jgi:hypothetical protein
MIQSGKETQETIPEQVPLSAEEWAQTPAAVQWFVLSLLAHVQALETEMAALLERVNRNSHNSSKPPSSDGPGVSRKPRRRAKSGRKRGAQPGHKGMTRKLVPRHQAERMP